MPPITQSPTPERGSTSNRKGDYNLPDIATRAGVEPLNSASQSESGDPSEAMETEVEHRAGEKSLSLVQTAQDALPLVDGTNRGTGDHPITQKPDGIRRLLSKIYTQDLNPSSKLKALSEPVRSYAGKAGLENQVTSTPKDADITTDSTHNLRGFLPRPSPPSSNGPYSTARRRRSQSLATSTMRKFAIPDPEGLSGVTLPAMHSSPPSLSAKSPKGQQTLPPLLAHFGPLVEGRSPNDTDIRPNGLGPSRQTFPPMSGSIRSPPLGSITSRTTQYPSPRARLNGRLPPPYPPPQPSPASTYSDASPREPYRHNPDTTNMSPPGRFGHGQYYSDARTPQSDDLTPISAESHLSAGNFSADTSPNRDSIGIEGRPILPPLGSVPLTMGLFKCENADCPALPFQTQYLLNSHMNVHSQNRPHYCPVKTCNRSEGGKGFKRKNEMIRHGLVHQSPGYICPFCPEREHKYPRPDNLQRHVRVNHPDKDLNDAQLREVLAQRLEGGTRGRRRRLGG